MSRYDFFTETTEGYPDVFAVDRSVFDPFQSKPPVLYQLTQPEAERFDLVMLQFYQSIDYMWIVLWLNGFSNAFDLVAGLYLSLPDKRDLDTINESSWRR